MTNMFKRDMDLYQIPDWYQIGFIVLVVLYMALNLAIQYTYGHVVATLAMVEEPQTTAFSLRAPFDDEPDATLPPYSDEDKTDAKEPLIRIVEQEVLLVKQKPVTASLKNTIRHLRAHGGFMSRFRGAGVLVTYAVLLHTFISVWHMFFTLPVMGVAGYVVAQIALARISMLWTHVVISQPSSKTLYQRIVSHEVGKKIMIPTALSALVQAGLPAVPLAVFYVVDAQKYLSVRPLDDLDTNERVALAFKLFTVLAAGIAYFFVCFIPVMIGLVRCQAALLSEEEIPIVSFDRSFGGKFVPVSEGGSGAPRLTDAWKSFDWNGRVRLIKVWIKTLAMQCALTVFFLIFAAILVTPLSLLL